MNNLKDATDYLSFAIRAAIKDTERRYGVYVWTCGNKPSVGEDFGALQLVAHVWPEAMRLIEPEPEPVSEAIG